MSYSIETKAGLIGYLQGSISGTVRTVKTIVESKSSSKEQLEHYLKVTLDQLQRALTESEKIWQEVKHK